MPTTNGLPTFTDVSDVTPIDAILTGMMQDADDLIVARTSPVAPVAIDLSGSGYGALAGYGALRYELGRDGHVTLTGGVIRTAATASGVASFGIGSVPAGAAPDRARNAPVSTQAGVAMLSIATSGAMTLTYPAAINVTAGVWWVVVDGYRYRVTEA